MTAHWPAPPTGVASLCVCTHFVWMCGCACVHVCGSMCVQAVVCFCAMVRVHVSISAHTHNFNCSPVNISRVVSLEISILHKVQTCRSWCVRGGLIYRCTYKFCPIQHVSSSYACTLLGIHLVSTWFCHLQILSMEHESMSWNSGAASQPCSLPYFVFCAFTACSPPMVPSVAKLCPSPLACSPNKCTKAFVNTAKPSTLAWLGIAQRCCARYVETRAFHQNQTISPHLLFKVWYCLSLPLLITTNKGVFR